MKKILIILLAILAIGIVLGVSYYIGVEIGKKEEKSKVGRNEIDEENKTLKNEEFKISLIKEKNEGEKILIPNTIMKVKQIDMQEKKITVKYVTNDEPETNGDEGMFRGFFLERKENNEWYYYRVKSIRAVPTIAILPEEKKKKIELGKEYEIECDFSEIYNVMGLPRGKYRIVFVSNASEIEARYAEAEFTL